MTGLFGHPARGSRFEGVLVSARRLLPLLCLSLSLGAVSAAGATPQGPNGRIAFALNGGSGDGELYSVNADGSALRRLTWSPQVEQAPSWSPDGTRIAYESFLGGNSHIWVMNADGSGQTELTSGTQNMDPAWSPDGTQIAFARPTSNGLNLFVMNADGSALRRVSDVFGSGPAWSPDGRRIAYVGLDGIGVVDIDGRDPHRISALGAFAAGPSWSPDGTRIVFTRNNADGYPGELFVMNADGSGEQQLTSDGYGNASPSWSPDGTEIVFQRTATPPFGPTLWAIGIDGNGLRQITSTAGAIQPDWGSSQVVPEPSPPGAPIIQIYSPDPNRPYLPTSQVEAFYLCSSYVTFIVSCDGDVPVGAPLDLSQAGTRTFSVRAVDAEGRTATATVTYYVYDIVPPQIDIRTPLDGATYDLGAQVTVDFSCSDPNGTGVQACVGDRPVGAPVDTGSVGTHTFHVYSLDNSRNLSEKTSTYTVVDRRPPTIQITSPGKGATYTLGDAVAAAYSCASSPSAHIVSCLGPVANGASVDTSTVGTKTFTVNAADDQGKTTTATFTYTVIDRRPPTIQITSPGEGATYALGDAVSAAYSCASSPGAHIVSCLGPVANGTAVDTRTIGAKAFTVNAADNWDKTATAIQSYFVVYAFGGFDSPVNAGGSIGSAKAGDSVPLKFSLRGNQGLGAVTQTTWQPSSCTDWGALGSPTAAQTKLSYSTSTDRYVDLVTTDPTWKGSCRTVDVWLADGTRHSVHVQFTK
jgi:Tol biopolymer transport system component